MEGERKYRQNGYQDSGSRDSSNGQPRRDERPKPQGPRPPLDVTGPRLPRLVQSVTAARCYNCSTTLLPDIDFKGKCPKCGASLHCCKQCSYFEPSTRFQCLKPIPARIAIKDQANECTLFKPRFTVARDAAHPPASNGYGQSNGNGHGNSASLPNIAAPRNASDARAAFDSLFKKSE
jgi:hypothetical protein